MITVAICDDEYRFRKNIEKCCRQYFTEKDIDYQILEYSAGETFLAAEHPDILVIDVMMRRLSGFFVKDILAKMHAETRILFVAGNKNVMSEAFGKNVFGFLIKPLNFQMFCEKMDRMIEDIQDRQCYVYCKSGSEIERVYLKSILYIESYGRYTKVYVQGAKTCKVSDLGIRKWSETLSPQHYVQCSRMHIVNLLYVTKVDNEIELINGIRLPLANCYKKVFDLKYECIGGK